MNNKEKKTHSMKARGMISDVVVHVVLALLAIVWVIPVLWIALLSFSRKDLMLPAFSQRDIRFIIMCVCLQIRRC